MQNLNTEHNNKRVEILVRGTVQGVGFRPFIFNLASRFKVAGSVANTGRGVVITAVASSATLQQFQDAIVEEAPPLARIISCESHTLPLTDPPADQEGDPLFTILPSQAGSAATTTIPPDIGLCRDCLSELLDPEDRRYHYPFINCTNCGPRYTIVEQIPYDRPKTSMKVFPMCPACKAEYHNPRDRRFHAQPNACPACGPHISLHDKDGNRLHTKSALARTAKALKAGMVVALRGLGGFHLAVDACSPEAVALLRQRKGRPDKPLAVMVADLAAAGTFCHLNKVAEKILTTPEQPIVLLKKKHKSRLAGNLAPGIDELGVMLPYTPLHHLLFQQEDCPEALVMTSGNFSGNPICTANSQALHELRPVADRFLLHNREIVTRMDDSVVRIMAGMPILLRRARGYAPAPLQIPWQLPNVLACGAGLKNTFALGREQHILLSQHIGDLNSLAVYDFYQQSIEHCQKVFQFTPEIVACDLHPDYLSSRYGAEGQLPLYPVQHHHAHAVAVMAEHGLKEPVLAVILDGTGLGDDGTVWGGEILQAELTGFTRLGHLSQLHLPGGDAAATEPWRMGIAALFHCFGAQGISADRLPTTLKQEDREKLRVISSMLASGFNAPLTSSCGRLFDAVAALLGVRRQISYEGQAAMELESLAKSALSSTWPYDIMPSWHTKSCALLTEKDGKWEICSAEFVKIIIEGMHKGVARSALSLEFHTLLIATITRLVDILSRQTGIRKVVLAGGCMQNSLLLEGLLHTLKDIHLTVHTSNSLPLNDGAIAIGQAIIGGLRHVSRNSDAGNQRPGRS